MYNVHTDNFDGPMDLLLHLVKETKLDIYEINMTDIIDSYLAYLDMKKELNIDIDSEFILMASTLLHIKSRKLVGVTEESDEEENEYSINSEEELKERLIEYEKYKNIISDLKELEDKRKDVYTKLPSNLSEYEGEVKIYNEEGFDSLDLQKALISVLERLRYKEPVEKRITKKEMSVSERKEYITNILKERGTCEFTDLFEENTRPYIVVTFLAILEMAKNRDIILKQDNNFSTIKVEACV